MALALSVVVPAYDEAAHVRALDLDDVIARVSALVADRPEVAEVDLNPVLALERGAAVADARILLL